MRDNLNHYRDQVEAEVIAITMTVGFIIVMIAAFVGCGAYAMLEVLGWI